MPCILTWSDVRVWAEKEERPPCTQHRHISVHEALMACSPEIDIAIWLTDNNAIVLHDSNLYDWRKKHSGPYEVMQLTKIGS